MGTFLFVTLKKILGYVAARLLKPESIVELMLDLADSAVARTDSKIDDKVVKDIRKALGHDKE